ncbi:hypothetical protein [Streptomyces sp. NPDC059761]|uniref:hypothetical protein n=1 Tax=Streptomyces sp. NPDC059761 TaxID=3346937 RepID=UPI0036635860
MSVLTPMRHALATANAYLRIDLTTGRTDVICGAQADYLLVDIHRDDHIQPGPFGRYQITAANGRIVRLAPIASRAGQMTPFYKHCTLPDGRTSYAQALMSDSEVRKATAAADGTVHRLLDGGLIRVHRGRCAETWTPLVDNPKEIS